MKDHPHRLLNRVLLCCFAFFFGVCPFLGSQEKVYHLSTNQSGSTKVYMARDSIRLLPGFSYKAQGSQTFLAGIDAGLIFPPAATYLRADGSLSPDPTQGGVVGSIPGSFALSATGGATYSLPIECPAGINGMQPSISLVYNSQGGRGLAGWGWNLSGLSAITKGRKNQYDHNEISGLDISKEENYYLDGNLLLQLSGEYGEHGATYKTEYDKSVVIESINEGSMYPESFIVKRKDGLIMEYARLVFPMSNDDSQDCFSPYQWLLTSTMDRNGNGVYYSYQTKISNIDGAQQVVIRTISYSGGLITFEYTSNQQVHPSYVGGCYLADAFSLSKIKVSTGVNMTPLRTYTLSYSVNGDKRFLYRIGLSGLDGERLNHTYVYWGDNVNTIALDSVSIPNPSSYMLDIPNRYFINGDMDGDGVCDLIEIYHRDDYVLRSESDQYMDKSTDSVKVYKMKLVNGKLEYDRLLLEREIGPSQDMYFSLPLNCFLTGAIQSVPFSHVIDYDHIRMLNGSGLLAGLNASSVKTIVVPVLHEVNESGVRIELRDLKSNVAFWDSLYASSRIPVYLFGDVNNDGIDEIISFERVEKSMGLSASGKAGLPRSGLNGTIRYLQKNDMAAETFTLEDHLAIESLDFDGFIEVDGSFTRPEVRSAFLSDLNADGLNDLMIVTSSGTFFMKNEGGVKGVDGLVHVSFTQLPFYDLHMSLIYKPGEIKSGDFNGDGLMDFLLYDGLSSFTLHLNQGNFHFTHEPLFNVVLHEDVCDGVEGCERNDVRDDFIITDFNQDGKSDIIIYDASYLKRCTNGSAGICLRYKAEYVGSSIYWYTSQGSSFQLARTVQIQDEDYYFKGNATGGDFDGDGRPDLFSFGSNLYSETSGVDQGHFYRSFNPDFSSDLITSIVDGNSNRMQFRYRSILHRALEDGSPFYSSSSNVPFFEYPIRELRNPLICVEGMSFESNQNHLEKKYSYSDAQIHVQGKGFLGFGKQCEVNHFVKTKTVQETIFDYTYCLPTEKRVLVSTLNETPIYKTIQTFSNSKSDCVYTSRLHRSQETDALSTLSSITEYEYDDYGNPVIIRSTKGNLVETQTIEYGQFGSWCLNKPTRVQSMRQMGLESIVRELEYNYDSKGNLIKEIVDPGDVNEHQTVYSDFTMQGQARSQIQIANGCSRSISVSFTPSGRYIKSKIDELGQTTEYEWDETRGLLLSEQSRLGTTSYKYDGFGRPIESTLPDGIRQASVMRWAEPGNRYDALYYSYTESSGLAPSRVWYDAFGREILREESGLKETIRVFTQYDAQGRVLRVSDPTFGLSPDTWAIINQYDDSGRILNRTTASGQTIYTYNGLTTSEKSPSATIQTQLLSNGLVDYVKTNGKSVNYTYYASGLLKTSTPQGGVPIQFDWDVQGNRTELMDPDAGRITSVYDGFGQILSSKRYVHDSLLVTTTFDYNPMTGLIASRHRNAETTTYSYDALHRLIRVEIAGKHKQEFSYDDWDRITQRDEQIDGMHFVHQTQYDQLGRERLHIYPSGYYTRNHYNSNGYLAHISDVHGRLLYEIVEENPHGQPLKVRQGQKVTNFIYDSLGRTTSINAPSIIDLGYAYDENGNMQHRSDNRLGLLERFDYDEQNRLGYWELFQNEVSLNAQWQHYCGHTGTIERRSVLDDYSMHYDLDGRPHSLDSISGQPSIFSSDPVCLSYTDFNKMQTLSEGEKLYTIVYGVDDQRRKSLYQVGGRREMTRYYLGDYEEEVDVNGDIRKIHYLSGGAVLIQSHGVDSLLFVYTDHQGSLIALTDEEGSVLERYAYDPWGRRLAPLDLILPDSRLQHLLNRGYTGHEHLDGFGLIDMNGRVYDPLTAQFISPDPFIQAPENWLNYNRYGYCLNNPLLYTDPSGEFWHIVIAAAVGGVVNTVSNWSEISKSANPWVSGIAYFANGAIAYGVSAAVPALTYQAMGVMGAGNIALDAAHGSLPSLNNSVDVGFYAVGTVLDMVGVASAPGIASAAKSAFSKWGTEVAIEGTSKIVSRSLDGFAVEGAEWTIIAAKEASGSTASRLAMSLADDVAKGSTSLVKTGTQFSKHSLERLAQRGVTQDMAELAISEGHKFYDPLNKSINYVLPNGFASGKSLLVGTNPLTGEVTTVIRSSKNLINTRFIPIQ